jgi:hypothetical protein
MFLQFKFGKYQLTGITFFQGAAVTLHNFDLFIPAYFFDITSLVH